MTLILLADETDEAWADLYSCTPARCRSRTSSPGLRSERSSSAWAWPVSRSRWRSTSPGILLLIGSVFVPLFGVLAADYFGVRGRYTAADLLGLKAGVSWRGMAAWALGIAPYLWLAGAFEVVGLRGVPSVGASVPSLLVAGAAHLALARRLPTARPRAPTP